MEEPDPRDRPIEPGDPSAEHVAFVLLGVVVTIIVFAQGLGLF